MFTTPSSRDIELPQRQQDILPWAQEITRRANRRIHGDMVKESFGDILIATPEEPPGLTSALFNQGTYLTTPLNMASTTTLVFSGSGSDVNTDPATNQGGGVILLDVAEETDPNFKVVAPGTYKITVSVTVQVGLWQGSTGGGYDGIHQPSTYSVSGGAGGSVSFNQYEPSYVVVALLIDNYTGPYNAAVSDLTAFPMIFTFSPDIIANTIQATWMVRFYGGEKFAIRLQNQCDWGLSEYMPSDYPCANVIFQQVD